MTALLRFSCTVAVLGTLARHALKIVVKRYSSAFHCEIHEKKQILSNPHCRGKIPLDLFGENFLHC